MVGVRGLPVGPLRSDDPGPGVDDGFALTPRRLRSHVSCLMSDDIIHLSDYLGEREARTTFSVVGGEGERSRFALPVWRAVYLLAGDRGGIVWTSPSDEAPRAFFVLDLAADPARTTFDPTLTGGLGGREAPAVEVLDEAVTVLLARDEHRSWYLVVVGRSADEEEPGARAREDLLFLAGECAGLLVHRDMASDL